MSLAPTRSVSPRRPTTPDPLGVTDPGAIATFLRGVPLDDAFWRRFRYQCDHCQRWDTTASGALWRVSPADDCTELYYLHSRCLTPYKVAHNLKSVEGRLLLRRPGGAGERDKMTPWNWHEDDARIRRENDEAGLAERDAHQDATARRRRQDTLPATADGASATWRTRTVTDPTVGAITTLYSPDSRPIAYAVGRDNPALVRVAARLNAGDGVATTGAVQR